MAGEDNSVPKKQITPRISMIAALDSSGEMYVTLMQSITNSGTMELFMTHFIKQLEEEDKYWRKNTIFIADGASYHTSQSMM